MEEINLKDLFSFFVSKLRTIILVLLIVLLIGSIYSLAFKPAKYESTTTLVLTGTTDGASKEDETGITNTDLTLNAKLVSTYREIIKSTAVIKTVIASENLDYSVEELKSMITVSSVKDTEMISISVRSEDATEAANVVNELAKVFSEKIVDIYNIENISIIDKGEIEVLPINLNIVKSIAIYTLIGLALGISIVFIEYYFDNTVKDAAQVENLGLTVLTSVPEKQEEKKKGARK